MSRRAWVLVCCVLGIGGVIAASDAAGATFDGRDLVVFAALATVASVLGLFEATIPVRQSRYTYLVFLFAGVLLLPPMLFALLVATPQLAVLVQEQVKKEPRRDWYTHPFNISAHLIAGLAARGALLVLGVMRDQIEAAAAMPAVLVAGVVFMAVNGLLVSSLTSLARRIPFRKAGALAFENIALDSIQMCLGYIIAVLCNVNPWLALPALSPLLLLYRVLKIPQLEQEAQTDVKTGLWNARHFQKLFAAELVRARRFGRPMAVMMADLDLLRNINNTYGHLAGDVVLAGVGTIIRETAREYDIAARFGGEEFSLVLPEVSCDEALAIAETLRSRVAAAAFVVRTSVEPISATLSIGVACYPRDGEAPADLIHRADLAVLHAKQAGRNRVVAAADLAAESVPPSHDDRLLPAQADVAGRPSIAAD